VQVSHRIKDVAQGVCHGNKVAPGHAGEGNWSVDRAPGDTQQSTKVEDVGSIRDHRGIEFDRAARAAARTADAAEPSYTACASASAQSSIAARTARSAVRLGTGSAASVGEGLNEACQVVGQCQEGVQGVPLSIKFYQLPENRM